MRKLIAALCFAVTATAATAATAAPAQNPTSTIAPADAKAHVGQAVTVEGAVSGVHISESGATFIDVGGNYPDNAFTAVIFAADRAEFPGVSGLEGKVVDINGAVQLYRGRPEIILKSAQQVTAK
jgi:DNA/RNA endonuclease YhcR with UshA esterase domain